MTPGLKKGLKRWSWRVVKVLLGLGILGAALIGYSYLTAVWASRGLLFDRVADLPETKVGLVFGTTDRVNGRENLYFKYRIDAAVEVWKSGKLEILIVSGDNLSRYYNEPEKMKQALVERGIPADSILSDPRGLRTLDSVVRVKEGLGSDSVLMISQRFQNERAIYLAKANGIKAYGFNARDVGFQAGLKTRIREVGARVMMWLDVNWLQTKPAHSEKKVEMPE